MKKILFDRSSEHESELKNVQEMIKLETEREWMAKLKYKQYQLHVFDFNENRNELESLHNELDEQHNEMQQSAINKVIEIKEGELRVAKENWMKQEKYLLNKVSFYNTKHCYNYYYW